MEVACESTNVQRARAWGCIDGVFAAAARACGPDPGDGLDWCVSIGRRLRARETASKRQSRWVSNYDVADFRPSVRAVHLGVGMYRAVDSRRAVREHPERGSRAGGSHVWRRRCTAGHLRPAIASACVLRLDWWRIAHAVTMAPRGARWHATALPLGQSRSKLRPTSRCRGVRCRSRQLSNRTARQGSSARRNAGRSLDARRARRDVIRSAKEPDRNYRSRFPDRTA